MCETQRGGGARRGGGQRACAGPPRGEGGQPGAPSAPPPAPSRALHFRVFPEIPPGSGGLSPSPPPTSAPQASPLPCARPRAVSQDCEPPVTDTWRVSADPVTLFPGTRALLPAPCGQAACRPFPVLPGLSSDPGTGTAVAAAVTVTVWQGPGGVLSVPRTSTLGSLASAAGTRCPQASAFPGLFPPARCVPPLPGGPSWGSPSGWGVLEAGGLCGRRLLTTRRVPVSLSVGTKRPGCPSGPLAPASLLRSRGPEPPPARRPCAEFQGSCARRTCVRPGAS